jgi:type II secretory pathway pseudopilin PulG
MTFIEVLIATALVALVAGILLTAFGFSLVNMKRAENVLSSTFVAQSKIETLQGMDAAAAFEEGRRERRQFMDKYVETTVKPYFDEKSHAFYIILGGADADIYAVPPDNGGALRIPSVTGSRTISICISSNSYSITSAGYQALGGSLPQDQREVMVLINGVKYSSPGSVTIKISAAGRIVRAWVYDDGSNAARVSVSGSNVDIKRYSGYTYRDYSTVKAQVRVYDRQDDLQPSATFNGIFQLKN